MNDDNGDNKNIINLILNLVSNDLLLIEILDKSKLVVDFDNFALIINYNNISRAKDFNNVFINVLFIELRIVIKDNNSLIAKDNNKEFIKKLNSSSNSF